MNFVVKMLLKNIVSCHNARSSSSPCIILQKYSDNKNLMYQNVDQYCRMFGNHNFTKITSIIDIKLMYQECCQNVSEDTKCSVTTLLPKIDKYYIVFVA